MWFLYSWDHIWHVKKTKTKLPPSPIRKKKGQSTVFFFFLCGLRMIEPLSFIFSSGDLNENLLLLTVPCHPNKQSKWAWTFWLCSTHSPGRTSQFSTHWIYPSHISLAIKIVILQEEYYISSDDRNAQMVIKGILRALKCCSHDRGPSLILAWL